MFTDCKVDGVHCGPDGFRADVFGNLWCASNAGRDVGYSGVTVWSPEGKLLGRIRLPEICGNVTFGGPKRNRLFMVASQSLYAVYTARKAPLPAEAPRGVAGRRCPRLTGGCAVPADGTLPARSQCRAWRQPRRASSIVAMSIFRISIIASKARLAAARSGSVIAVGQGARRDLPRQAPLVLAPAARALLAAVADDRVPQAVGLGLVVGRDLERERLAVLERRPAVEAEAGDAQHGELDRQHVALLARRESRRARGGPRRRRCRETSRRRSVAASSAVPSYQRQMVFLGVISISCR